MLPAWNHFVAAHVLKYYHFIMESLCSATSLNPQNSAASSMMTEPSRICHAWHAPGTPVFAACSAVQTRVLHQGCSTRVVRLGKHIVSSLLWNAKKLVCKMKNGCLRVTVKLFQAGNNYAMCNFILLPSPD